MKQTNLYHIIVNVLIFRSSDLYCTQNQISINRLHDKRIPYIFL